MRHPPTRECWPWSWVVLAGGSPDRIPQASCGTPVNRAEVLNRAAVAGQREEDLLQVALLGGQRVQLDPLDEGDVAHLGSARAGDPPRAVGQSVDLRPAVH